MNTPRYPDVLVRLDGTPLEIIARVRDGLREDDAPEYDVVTFVTEACAYTKNFTGLREYVRRWVTVKEG